jgi:hypothetical protein
MFDGRSDPRAPVARPSLCVSHSNDLNVVAPKDVHKTEGESRKDIPSGTASLARPRLRILRHRIDGVP